MPPRQQHSERTRPRLCFAPRAKSRARARASSRGICPVQLRSAALECQALTRALRQLLVRVTVRTFERTQKGSHTCTCAWRLVASKNEGCLLATPWRSDTMTSQSSHLTR